MQIKKNRRIILEKVEKDCIQSRVGRLTIVRSNPSASELRDRSVAVSLYKGEQPEGVLDRDMIFLSWEAGSFLD